MKIKGKGYILTPAEKAIIKTHIDKKFGKKTNSTNYRSSSPEDKRISIKIEKVTEKPIKDSTLGRLTGVDKYSGATSASSLDIVAEYLDFKDGKALLNSISETLRIKEEGNSFNVKTLFRNHNILIKTQSGKSIKLEYLSGKFFIIKAIENSSYLEQNDKLEIKTLEIGEKFICSDVVREKEETILNKDNDEEKINKIHLGEFRIDTVESIELLKKD